MAVPLAGLARALGRIASADPGTPEGAVAAAMRAHPELVGGTRRDVTALMRGTDGLVAKDGAESVYAAGLADGTGIALKIADGGQRARPVVLAAVLRRLGVESGAYARLEDAPVLGHGERVGAVVAHGIDGTGDLAGEPVSGGAHPGDRSDRPGRAAPPTRPVPPTLPAPPTPPDR